MSLTVERDRLKDERDRLWHEAGEARKKKRGKREQQQQQQQQQEDVDVTRSHGLKHQSHVFLLSLLLLVILVTCKLTAAEQ